MHKPGQSRVSAERQIDGKKACCDRKGAWNDVFRCESIQNEVKEKCNYSCGKPHQYHLRLFYMVHLHLGTVALVGIAKPGYQRKYSHWHGHSKIGDHFSVISEDIRNDTVKQAEDNHKDLPEGIALGIEYKRGRSDHRCKQRKVICSVENDERNDYQQY